MFNITLVGLLEIRWPFASNINVKNITALDTPAHWSNNFHAHTKPLLRMVWA